MERRASNEAQVLSVYLRNTSVGTLTCLPTEQIVFAFAEGYISNPNRPVLSLSYKEPLGGLKTKIKPTSVNLPPFFSNLLPEGKLRTYLARRANVKEAREFFLLRELSDDLPGAIILQHSGSLMTPNYCQEHEQASAQLDGPLRFSLAGLQLKFSGDLLNNKVVIPVKGAGGHWIVKLPSPSLPDINELEYSMLILASKVGITVPDVQLMPSSQLEGLPADLPDTVDGSCLISRRFDRQEHGARIHMEDFNQVFGLYDKYDPQFNYQSIAHVLWTEIGLYSVLEFVRRLVFMIVTGNADMHLKNWTLIYPDERRPQLSPAYDFVPTILYPGTYDKLALKLAGENRFQYLSKQSFKNFAAIAKLPENPILDAVDATLDAINQTWPQLVPDLPIPASLRRLLSEHMKSLPLLHYHKTAIVKNHIIVESKAQASLSLGIISGTVELSRDVPEGKITYKSTAGQSFELDAPRRMLDGLIKRQADKLLLEHPELKGQHITAYVGPRPFDEWRQENFVRVENRHLQTKLTTKDLKGPQVSFRAAFFPSHWRKLEMHWKHKNPAQIDFAFADDQLWTCECTVESIGNVSALKDGSQTADVRLKVTTAKPLLNVPE